LFEKFEAEAAPPLATLPINGNGNGNAKPFPERH